MTPPPASLGGPGRRLPRVYRGAVTLDDDRALFTLQALTKASDAQDVRVESTKLKDYDIESQVWSRRLVNTAIAGLAAVPGLAPPA